MRKKAKRPFLLLEVLIAIFLVAVCIVPLLSPYSFLFRDQQAFADKISLEHATNVIYASVVEKLYKHQIAWDAIEGEHHFPIEEELLRTPNGRKLPWKGEYYFQEIKHKPKDKDLFTVYLFKLILKFKPIAKGFKESSVDYTIFIVRQLPELPGQGIPPGKKDGGKAT